MRYIDSTLNLGGEDRLVAWLDRGLRTASVLTLRSGFYSAAAIEVVREGLEEFLRRGGELLAVLGGDALQMDPECLHVLLGIVEQFPETARVYVVMEPVFQNA